MFSCLFPRKHRRLTRHKAIRKGSPALEMFRAECSQKEEKVKPALKKMDIVS